MAKKRKSKDVAQPPTSSEAPAVQPSIEAPIEGEIRLVVPRLNAHKVLCPSGAVIAPDVDGWPEARVALHLRHGHAEVIARKLPSHESDTTSEETDSSEQGATE